MLMTMHKALNLRDDIECMCQEKSWRGFGNIEDFVGRFEDSRITLKRVKKTNYSYQ